MTTGQTTHAAGILVDILAAFGIIGAIINWFPYLAAFSGFIWYLIQIYESNFVQTWLTKRQGERLHARTARLQEEAIRIAQELEKIKREETARIVAVKGGQEKL